MYFSKSLLVVTAGLAAQVAADGCHSSDDGVGKTCFFKDRTHWEYLVNHYCGMYDPGRAVPAGGSVGGKELVPDGYGGVQYFWGNHRVDRGQSGNREWLITFTECHDDMMKIWDICPNLGGWIDTAFGTVFAECIRV